MAPRLREGFAGQDMFVIPRPILAEAHQHPLVNSLFPTDVGWYPQALYHYRQRVNGAPEDHLMLCVGGHGFVEIDDSRTELRPGQMLVIPRNRRHTYWAADDDPWSIYWMHFLGENADYYIDRMPHVGQTADVEESTQQEAVRLFRDCLDALSSGYAMSTLIYAAQSAQHILSLLMFRNAALPILQQTAQRRAMCNSVIDFMKSRLAEPANLEEFAEHAGLSVSHFSEQFRKETHHSPMAFYTHLRIRAACRLLDFSREPVKTVAARTGYSDPYYFSRVFKKTMGVSPENYRKIVKG